MLTPANTAAVSPGIDGRPGAVPRDGWGRPSRGRRCRAAALAADVDAFYAAHAPEPAADTEVLVVSFDAKGVVMRPDVLRAATAKAATSQKLSTRLSKGEKRHRKRCSPGRRPESHRPPPIVPYVTVSRHTAPTIRLEGTPWSIASARTGWARVARPSPTTP